MICKEWQKCREGEDGIRVYIFVVIVVFEIEPDLVQAGPELTM